MMEYRFIGRLIFFFFLCIITVCRAEQPTITTRLTTPHGSINPNSTIRPSNSIHRSPSVRPTISVRPSRSVRPSNSVRPSKSVRPTSTVSPTRPATTTPATNTTETPTTGVFFKCDFEKDDCRPVVSRPYRYWRRRQATSSSYNTGPNIDNTRGDRLGHYIYQSRNYFTGRTYLEYRISNTQSSKYCLRFAYHMYGSQIGTLTVGYRTFGNLSFKSIWTMSGNKGDFWQQAEITFNTRGTFNLVFEVYQRSYYHSYDDIALDDIFLTDECPKEETLPSLPLAMLPFGSSVGDSSIYRGTNRYSCRTVSNQIPLFTSSGAQRVCINSRGYMNVDFSSTTSRLSFPLTYTALVAYYQNFYSNSNIYHRFTTTLSDLTSINRDVVRYLNKQNGTLKNFSAKSAMVVTYDNVDFYPIDGSKAKFQTIVATDLVRTFIILNYERLDKNAAFAGFFEPGCTSKMITKPSLTRDLNKTSNVGIPGKHVYMATNKECINEGVMYPYGPGTPDTRFSSYYGSSRRIQNFKGAWALFSRSLQPIIYIHSRGALSFENTFYGATTSTTYVAPYHHYPNSNERQGTTYYRETTNKTILSMATEDIQASPNATANFTAKHAFVATFIRKGFRFQMVLATDSMDTYAVMNYEQLSRDANHVGMNEIGCGLKYFTPRFNSAKTMMNGSTNGIRGRHVFLLTTRGCYKRVTGVRNVNYFNYNIYGSSLFRDISRRFQILKANEISKVLLHISEGRSNRNDAFTTMVSIHYNGKNPETSYNLRSLIYKSNPAVWYVGWQNIFVLLGTRKTKDFQYGSTGIISVDSEMICHKVFFEQKMSSVPSIKVTATAKNTDMSNMVFTWLHNVSTEGFSVCLKEIITFSGPRHLNVSFIAATTTDKTVSEVSHENFSKAKTLHCKIIQFNNSYIISHRDSPSVMVTPEIVKNDNEKPVVTWVNRVTDTFAEVCMKSKRREEIKVHLVVKGTISPCTGFSCPDHLECRLTSKLQPFCGCINSCYGKEGRGELCGSDYKTYPSICLMNRQHCYRYGNLSETNVTVMHYSRCQIKSFQSGRTQLEAIPDISGVFCKYINIDNSRFLPVSVTPLKVLLTVSWNKQSFTVPNDASASWSEDVTVNGFKACALVSGRHANSDFKNPPMVHWTVFQEQFFNGRYQAGQITLDTWYTGTQCKIISSNYYRIPPKVFTSVQHTKPKNYKNAMTVWSQISRRGYYYTSYMMACARELQNFDGIHDGIVINWLIIDDKLKEPFAPYIPEKHDIKFPSKTVRLGTSNPVECKSVKYNFGFPSLPNPTVLIGGVSTARNYYTSNVNAIYSQEDFAVWVEETTPASLTVCMKSVDTSYSNVATRPEIAISAIVIASLCEDEDEIFHDNSCYHKLPGCESNHLAHAKCLVKGSNLPIISNEAEQVFLQERISSATWIGFRRTPPNMEWVWDDGSTLNFTKWFPGQPANITGHNCAVMDEHEIEIGWKEEHCSACRHTFCEKDSNLAERSCKHFCLNGGTCRTGNYKNITNITCECPDGKYGKRCEIDITTIEGCYNYTTHNEGWRHIRNTTYTNITQINSTCDAKHLNDSGWHRFSGDAGSRIYAGSCVKRNSCGTRSPGWFDKSYYHPKGVGEMTRGTMHFHTFYCADDLGKVDIRNCGDFFTYRFIRFPYWSCDYGICTY